MKCCRIVREVDGQKLYIGWVSIISGKLEFCRKVKNSSRAGIPTEYETDPTMIKFVEETGKTAFVLNMIKGYKAEACPDAEKEKTDRAAEVKRAWQETTPK